MQNTNEKIIQSGLYSRLSQARYIAKGQGMKKENKLSHTRGVFQHGPGVYDFIHVYGWLENLKSPCILHKTRNDNIPVHLAVNSEIRNDRKKMDKEDEAQQRQLWGAHFTQPLMQVMLPIFIAKHVARTSHLEEKINMN